MSFYIANHLVKKTPEGPIRRQLGTIDVALEHLHEACRCLSEGYRETLVGFYADELETPTPDFGAKDVFMSAWVRIWAEHQRLEEFRAERAAQGASMLIDMDVRQTT